MKLKLKNEKMGIYIYIYIYSNAGPNGIFRSMKGFRYCSRE